jgi:hypothetical protein
MLTDGSHATEGLFPVGAKVVQQWLPFMEEKLKRNEKCQESWKLWSSLGGSTERLEQISS